MARMAASGNLDGAGGGASAIARRPPQPAAPQARTIQKPGLGQMLGKIGNPLAKLGQSMGMGGAGGSPGILGAIRHALPGIGGATAARSLAAPAGGGVPDTRPAAPVSSPVPTAPAPGAPIGGPGAASGRRISHTGLGGISAGGRGLLASLYPRR